MELSIRNIISQGKSPKATQQQRQELLSQFHKPESEFEFKGHLLDDLNEMEVPEVNKPFFDELFEKLWLKRKVEITAPPQEKDRYPFHFTRWAAVLVIGLLLGYFVHSFLRQIPPVYYTSIAPKGSISEMYLPDGSHIFLNAGSEIRYSVDGTDGMREVFLNGEAWFQVAKNEKKPFLVHTSSYDVRVTGTSFNVKAYPGDRDVVTTLVEGCVHVSSPDNEDFSKETVLKSGDQLVYNRQSGKIQVAEVNTQWATSWKDNKLVFVNMSLSELKILLERKFGVEIEIADKEILRYHYDGTIHNETILEVLDILKRTLPINYRIVEQKILIQKQ